MLITALETIRTGDHENLLWLIIETSGGQSGIGETFYAPGAVETYLHETVAPLILGQDAGAITRINSKLIRPIVGFASSGVEIRAASAVDIALWDILGQKTGLPVHALLGGKSREKIRIYNTCAGPHYVTKQRSANVDNWFGLDQARLPLDNLHGFEHEQARLAKELLAEGITGMKIWPFDRAAFANGGVGITPSQLEDGMRPFRLIREAAGSAMDIMVELHSLWDLESAKRIIRAVESVDPLWIEDPVRMDDIDALAELARFTRLPIFSSETLGPASAFLQMIARRACGIVCFDPGWCGGITQARAICETAAAAQLPVAPHDCTGPVGLAADAHLSIWAPTAMIQETVRAYTRGWYRDVVTVLPDIDGGFLKAPEGPGLGTALKASFLNSSGVFRRRTAAETKPFRRKK